MCVCVHFLTRQIFAILSFSTCLRIWLRFTLGEWWPSFDSCYRRNAHILLPSFLVYVHFSAPINCCDDLISSLYSSGSLATFSIALLPVICATLGFVVVNSSVCFLLLEFSKHLISLNSISSAHTFTFHCKNSILRTYAIAILLRNTLYVICNYKSILLFLRF